MGEITNLRCVVDASSQTASRAKYSKVKVAVQATSREPQALGLARYIIGTVSRMKPRIERIMTPMIKSERQCALVLLLGSSRRSHTQRLVDAGLSRSSKALGAVLVRASE